MAIIVGFVPFQCLEQPRTAPEVPKSHSAITLEANLLDVCVGQYEFPPDNRFLLGQKWTIWQQGDQLMGQATVSHRGQGLPDSEGKKLKNE